MTSVQGMYRWADVILGGLDNREARVAINLATARAGKVWIDGAIERLDGVARVFDPATGPVMSAQWVRTTGRCSKPGGAAPAVAR